MEEDYISVEAWGAPWGMFKRPEAEIREEPGIYYFNQARNVFSPVPWPQCYRDLA